MLWWRPTRCTKTRGEKKDRARRPRRPAAAACQQPEGPRHVRDRPPIAGVVGRESGEVRLEVIESASAGELGDVIDDACLGETTVNTDEWNGSNRGGKRHGRAHRTVDHSGPRCTWAIDADGDGLREVHCNTLEGLWTGVRNFLGVWQRFETKWAITFMNPSRRRRERVLCRTLYP